MNNNNNQQPEVTNSKCCVRACATSPTQGEVCSTTDYQTTERPFTVAELWNIQRNRRQFRRSQTI